MNEETDALFKAIKCCRVCESELLAGANPVLTIDDRSKILIVGQAPSTKVHLSGIPWDDQSGKELRRWLDVTEETFYDPKNFAIVPMGFCYPGKGKNGDLPPRIECATLWHERVLAQLQNVKLTLLIGQYAQSYYLGEEKYKTLTETVRNYQRYLPTYFPLPHPSPRNFIWMLKNRWFKDETVPVLREWIDFVLHKT
ncbi:uracil-DNA glycosylase family protein [Sphingobacterium sp. DN00404]|uniref:Uracil-DNA glycosylase family protein n=1 Tax=Sphingobacterium micropteri TaxID=2763501 RepID=A0ABR7YL32_9SPHI|nr:uracil-DNA glycosylase family protein [Sphingobacterium micropteri]MBD1432032.1 uracil-DNA glycosylase family protein [Sphingobacterium micropteri]